MFYSWIKRFLFIIALLTAFVGPAFTEEDERVSIYRDYDDGLFGRSLYRGVIFSVKLESFNRYNTLPVDIDGLTAYLISSDRVDNFLAGRGSGIEIKDKAKKHFSYNKDGISISFALEKAPKDLYEEINRTYKRQLADSRLSAQVIGEVTESYNSGYVIRVLRAENIYRPQYSRIDYEDILISAALIGDVFQPLWGIHNGNDLAAPGK